MPRGAFRSATLRPNGTVEVTGPFSLVPGDVPRQQIFVDFFLVQGDPDRLVVGRGSWTTGQPGLDWNGR